MEPKKRSWGRHYLPCVTCTWPALVPESSKFNAHGTQPIFWLEKNHEAWELAPHYNKKKMATFHWKNLMILVLLCALRARSLVHETRNKFFAKIQAAVSLAAFKLPSSSKNLIWCSVVNILSDSSDFISFLCFDFFWYRKTWTSAWFTNYLSAAHVIQ